MMAQYVFFVCHGESKWQKALMELDIVGMYVEKDHGLSENGRERAEQLYTLITGAQSAEKQVDVWLAKFLKPNRVMTSPFTRAIETAVIGLGGVLNESSTLEVVADARERRNACCSKDCTSSVKGEQLKNRARSTLTELYSGETLTARKQEVLAKLRTIRFETKTSPGQWWSEHADLDVEVADRMERLFLYVKKQPSNSSTILIGHPSYFRDACQRYILSTCNANEDVVASLQMNHIPPCGVVGVKVEWHDDLVHFVDVNPMFDTVLECPDMDVWRSGNLPTKRECLCNCVPQQTRGLEMAQAQNDFELFSNFDCTGCSRKNISNTCCVS